MPNPNNFRADYPVLGIALIVLYWVCRCGCDRGIRGEADAGDSSMILLSHLRKNALWQVPLAQSCWISRVWRKQDRVGIMSRYVGQ